jgi:hypothetical protein
MIGSPKVEAARDALYGVPLEAFVEERKRLVKDLRTSGDRQAAAEVAKLRKPSAAAWALNRVAREAPDVVDEWIKAAAHLRDASSRPAQVGGEAVRTAIASHRAATARMLDTLRERSRPGGRPVSEDLLDRARTLLQSATADASLAALLRRGSISEEARTEDTVGGVAAARRWRPRSPPARRQYGRPERKESAILALRARPARERGARTPLGGAPNAPPSSGGASRRGRPTSPGWPPSTTATSAWQPRPRKHSKRRDTR